MHKNNPYRHSSPAAAKKQDAELPDWLLAQRPSKDEFGRQAALREAGMNSIPKHKTFEMVITGKPENREEEIRKLNEGLDKIMTPRKWDHITLSEKKWGDAVLYQKKPRKKKE